jgi:hypothetical protein
MTSEVQTALKASLVLPAADMKILILLAEESGRSTNALRKSLCMHIRYVTQRCQSMEKLGLILGHRRITWFKGESEIEIVWTLAPALPEALAKLAAMWSPVLPSKAQHTAAEEQEQMRP